jgi:hypothetical protein
MSKTEARCSLPSPVPISVPSPYHLRLILPAAKSRLTRSWARHRPFPGRVVDLRFFNLLIPADAGIARTEQLLHEASGDLWAEADLLKPLCLLYAYTGRSADARAALARARSVFAGFGAQFALAESSIPADAMEMASGNKAAAERYLREGYAELRAIGDKRYLADIAIMLAEVLYAQGRFGAAQQMIDEAQTAPVVPDVSLQPACWAMQAQLIARHAQFSAARGLICDAEAHLPPVISPWDHAWLLKARAEVNRITGAPEAAAADLQKALQIYKDRQAPSLAAPVKAALVSLAALRDRTPP